MWVCDGCGAKFTFSRSYRKAWKHKRQKERIHHHHRTWMKNKSNHRQSLSLSLSLTHIQCLSSLCPHQSGVSLGLSLLWRQEVHLGLVTLQKLPADVTAATRATQTWSNIHTTWTVFRFSSSIRTWVLCVAPGRPCPPHPAAWTRWLLPLCWETGASWEIYLLPRL